MAKADVDALGCGENGETGKGSTKSRAKREKNECGQGSKAEVSVKRGTRQRTKASGTESTANSEEAALCAESAANGVAAGGSDRRTADRGTAVVEAQSAAVTEDTLAKYLSRLLGMPAGETAESAELCSAEGGNQNQAMTLVQSIVSKAIEKGDVAAFKEIRGMLASGDGSGSYIERLLCALCRMLEENRRAGAEKDGSPEDAGGKRRAGDGGALAGRPQEPE